MHQHYLYTQHLPVYTRIYLYTPAFTCKYKHLPVYHSSSLYIPQASLGFSLFPCQLLEIRGACLYTPVFACISTPALSCICHRLRGYTSIYLYLTVLLCIQIHLPLLGGACMYTPDFTCIHQHLPVNTSVYM